MQLQITLNYLITLRLFNFHALFRCLIFNKLMNIVRFTFRILRVIL